MPQQGTLGGSRDIMALRMSNTQVAAAIDLVIEAVQDFSASWADFSADDFVEMSNGDLSADDAYWQAAQIQAMPGWLESDAVKALLAYADRVRDVTR